MINHILKSNIWPGFLFLFVVLTFVCVKTIDEPSMFVQLTGKRKFADAVLFLTIGVVIPFIYMNIERLDNVLLKPFSERKEHIQFHTVLNRWSYLLVLVACLILLV